MRSYFSVQITYDYFKDIIDFWTTGTVPTEYNTQQKKQLDVRATNFTMIVGWLYKLGQDEVLRIYVLDHKRMMILVESHTGIVGGHSGNPTTQKVLTAGLQWPTLYMDVKEFCRSCDVCQCTGRPSRRYVIPLKPQVTLQAFDKWAIDFVGPINPLGKRTGSRYIITATDYLTRWAEAKLVKDYSIATTTQFIIENILTRFGCPRILMSDQGTHFESKH